MVAQNSNVIGRQMPRSSEQAENLCRPEQHIYQQPHATEPRLRLSRIEKSPFELMMEIHQKLQ